MLPEHIRKTRQAHSTRDALPATRRTALISLVFNRGDDLVGERRREMKRAPRELLAEESLDGVADQFEAMTRHWNPATARGVIERRRREALMWRMGFSALQLN
jgi:GH24 family phage-related lysozyme (muramidase)